MRRAKIFAAVAALVFSWSALAPAQDPGWPRTNVQQEGTLVSYQPQVDDWQNFTSITWRQAFQLTPAGGKLGIPVIVMGDSEFIVMVYSGT